MLSKSAIIHYDVIDSTNLESKRLIDKEKIFSPTWIIASKQTAGRGRGNKKWVSQEGNLLASLVLPINFPLDRFEKLIVDIGWESLDDWFNFWNTKKNILSIDQFWTNKVNDLSLIHI